MIKELMISNGFREQSDGSWTRQNLTAYGLVDLVIKAAPVGGYKVSAYKGSRRVSYQVMDEDRMLATVAAFLTS